MPVLAWWLHEIGKPVQERKWREFDDAARAGPLAGRAILELTLEELRHDLVERRLLGATPLESGGTARARHVDGGGFAWETR